MHQSRLVMNPSALAGFLDEIGDMPLDLQPTESKIRSAPRSPTHLRSFKWAKAQSLSEIKSIVTALAVAWAIATTSTQTSGTAMDVSVSFGREAHGVNELVVRLRIVQL